MKHKLYNRLLSLALALGLVVGMLPGMTFAGAVDTTAPQSQAEQIAEPTEEPEAVSEESSQAEATPTPAPESSQVEETPAPSQEPEDDSSANTPQTVNFSDVAPFLPPVVGGESVQSQAMMMLANRVNTNQDNSESEDSGLELSKNLLKNDNGKYSIQLEAYATGEIKVDTDEKTVPTDIVLVLDQSGSMGTNNIDVSVEPGYRKFNETRNDRAYNNRNNLYYFDGENYYQVTITRERVWGVNVYTYSWNGQSATSNTDRGSIPDALRNNLYYYSNETTESITRLEALKSAVSNFVASVQKQAAEDNVNHRIAMVGFASDRSLNYENSELIVTENRDNVRYDNIVSTGWNKHNYYTEAFLDVNVNGEVNDRLEDGIDYITAEGGTATNLGMEMAEKVLDENPVPQGEQRNRVVIVFTDGVPGIYNTDSDSKRNTFADSAIESSKNIKDAGTTVYTVGIFDGADAESGLPSNYYSWDYPERANRFMHLLSSNYPSATSMATSGSSIDDELGYYLSAADADTLNDIFQKISDNIQTGGSSSSLDSSAVVRDVLTQELQLPEGIESKDIAIQVYKANANTLTNPDAEGAWTLDSNAGVSASIGDDGRTIDVTGFDFSHNFVADKGRQENDVTQEGDFYGRKVVIIIPVEPNPDFLGGNNVLTNTNASGIYANEDAANAEDPKAEDYFESPNINIPVDPTVNGVDKTIHLTTSIPIESIIENMYQPNGWNNSKVTIIYEVKDSDGNVVNTYTIRPGETSGSWMYETTTLSPENCEEYTITCKVTPNEGILDSVENPVVTEKIVNDTATVHVLIPKVSVKDSEIDLGQTAYFSKNYNADDVKNQWVDRQGHTDSVPPASTTEPEVDLSYQFVRGSDPGNTYPASYNPTQDSDFKIVVKIGDRTLQLTNKEYTLTTNAIEHNNCIEPTEGNDHDFTIHVHTTNGMLVIQKKIVGGLAANGEPVFDFKVESPNGTVYYYHVIGQANGTVTATPENGVSLPAGDYTVTELYNQNYKATGVQITGGDQTTTTPGNNYSVTVSVKPNGTTTVTFTNTADDTKIPSDSGATQNNPDWTQDNIVTWNKDDDIVDGNVNDDYPATSN